MRTIESVDMFVLIRVVRRCTVLRMYRNVNQRPLTLCSIMFSVTSRHCLHRATYPRFGLGRSQLICINHKLQVYVVTRMLQ